MSVIELKSQIINKVNSIEDELLLEEIYNLINIQSESDSIYRLTSIEKAAIEVGLQEIKNGRTVPSEKANSIISEWLKK